MPDKSLAVLDKALLPSPEGASLAPLEAWRRSLDTSGQEYAREVETGVRSILGASHRFQEAWEACRAQVVAGQAAAVQAFRDRFIRSFEQRLAHLREALQLVQFAARVAGRELQEAEQLQAEISALAPALDRLASRWRTQEDLEELAAEDFPLPAAELKAIAAKHPPPQAWYDEDFQPF
jgi:hypothetical protein